MLDFKCCCRATPIKGKPEKTPYSMEALVEKNPEIILLLMGDSEEIENRHVLM